MADIKALSSLQDKHHVGCDNAQLVHQIWQATIYRTANGGHKSAVLPTGQTSRRVRQREACPPKLAQATIYHTANGGHKCAVLPTGQTSFVGCDNAKLVHQIWQATIYRTTNGGHKCAVLPTGQTSRRVRQREACPPSTLGRYKLRINLRNTKRFGWHPSATSRGTGNGSAFSQAAINSPERGAVIRPREPWPLLIYKPSSQGH